MSLSLNRELFLSTQRELASELHALSKDILDRKLDSVANELHPEHVLYFTQVVAQYMQEHALPQLEILTSYLDEARQDYRNFPSCVRERCNRIRYEMINLSIPKNNCFTRDIWVVLQMLALNVGRLNLEWNESKSEFHFSCRWNLKSRTWVVKYPIVYEKVDARIREILRIWESLNGGFDKTCRCYQCRERPGTRSGWLFGRSIFPQDLLN